MPLPKISAWCVRVEPHTVGGRYEIARWEGRLFEPTAERARVTAARIVHIRAGVPPWRPWLRQTYLRTSATAVEVSRGA